MCHLLSLPQERTTAKLPHNSSSGVIWDRRSVSEATNKSPFPLNTDFHLFYPYLHPSQLWWWSLVCDKDGPGMMAWETGGFL